MQAPVRDNSLSLALYVIFSVVILNFFITNLFVGVIVTSFSKMMEQVGGSNLLTGHALPPTHVSTSGLFSLQIPGLFLYLS